MKTTTVTPTYAKILRFSYIIETILALIACISIHIVVHSMTNHWLHEIWFQTPDFDGGLVALKVGSSSWVSTELCILTTTKFYILLGLITLLVIAAGWFFISLHKMVYWCAAVKDGMPIPTTEKVGARRYHSNEVMTYLAASVCLYYFIKVFFGLWLHEVCYGWPDFTSYTGVVLLKTEWDVSRIVTNGNFWVGAFCTSALVAMLYWLVKSSWQLIKTYIKKP